MANAADVRIGYAGKAYLAEEGTLAPADIAAAWPAGWEDLGLISEDGLTEGNDQDRTDIAAWGYDAPVRTQIIKRVTTFQIKFLETSPRVISLYYAAPLGDMVESGSGASQSVNFVQGQTPAPYTRALGLDIVDGSRWFRFVIPRAEVTERGQITYKGDEAVSYDVTFTTLLAADGSTMLRMYGGLELPA